MFLFSQCAFASETTFRSSGVEQCPHRAVFLGATSDDVVTLACSSHKWLLKHSTPIHSLGPVGEETLARVAENQASMEQLLDSGGN